MEVYVCLFGGHLMIHMTSSPASRFVILGGRTTSLFSPKFGIHPTCHNLQRYSPWSQSPGWQQACQIITYVLFPLFLFLVIIGMWIFD